MKRYFLVILSVVGIACLFGQMPLPYLENFDNSSSIPGGWNTTGEVWFEPGMGVDMTNCISGHLYVDYLTAFSITSPLVGPIVANTKLRFVYRILHWFGAATLSTQSFQVVIGDTVLYTIDSTTHTTSEQWATVVIPLDDYISQDIYIDILGLFGGSTGEPIELFFSIDDFYVFQQKDNELVAVAINGPITPSVNIPSTYTFKVFNDGDLTATNYTVKLKQETPSGDVELASVAGVSLPPLATYTFDLVWSPTQVGNQYIYGFVDFPADEYHLNNRTTSLPLQVYPQELQVAYIGDYTSEGYSSFFPFNYYFLTGISQSIYLENELPTTGVINQITYRFTGHGDIQDNCPVRLYLAHTDKSEYTHAYDWETPSQFTLVYEGILPVTQPGVYDIPILLDTPFQYTGGNIVIMTHRLWDPNDLTYLSYNNFQATVTPGIIRTIEACSNFYEIDLNYLPEGSVFYYRPNTIIFIDTSLQGSLSGVVTLSGAFVQGAEISLSGSHITGITDENGEYLMPLVPVGTYTATAKKHGYLNVSHTVEITHNNNTTQSFQIAPWPTVTLTGTVVDQQDGTPLDGCTIFLTGYETYANITTNEAGQFLIPDVYNNLTYTITIICAGYSKYIGEIEVGNSNQDLGDIGIFEYANRPYQLVATSSESSVQLEWQAPLPGEERWFTHTSTDEIFEEGIGTGDLTEYIIAHRYTQEQLQTFGVSGGKLIAISFVPYSIADFSIRIYTGGFYEWGLNCGELIYTQDIPTYNLRYMEWNEVMLNTAVDIPTTGEFWIGLYVDSPGGYPLAGTTELPYNHYGNVIYYWNEWITLTETGGYNKNWAIKGFALGAQGMPSEGVRVAMPHTARGELLAMPSEGVRLAMPSEGIRLGKLAFPHKRNAQKVTWNGLASSELSTIPTTRHGYITLDQDPPTRAFANYNIFRASVNNVQNPQLWTSIADDVTTTSYEDYTWGQITQGEYIYIVQAEYTADNHSQPTFSNPVSKNMYMTVNITLAPIDNGNIENALVRLINNTGNPDHAYTAIATSRTVTFPAVWIGQYTLIITRGAYETFTNYTLNVSTNPTNFTATLIPSPTLLWEDFEHNGAAPLGWISINNDGDNYGWMLLPTSPDWTYLAASPSFDYWAGMFGEPLDTDNYLVSTLVPLPAGAESINLTYDAYAYEELEYEGIPYDPNMVNERYTIEISSTDTDVNSFTPIYTGEITNTHVYPNSIHPNISLIEYAGNYVYIAFRHTNFNGTMMALDNIQITYEGSNSDADDTSKPLTTGLKGNYPNPFNPSTTINFEMAREGQVVIDVYNIKGQKVKTLVNGERGAGSHTIVWDGNDADGRAVSSGVYFYRLNVGEYSAVKKMLLMK